MTTRKQFEAFADLFRTYRDSGEVIGMVDAMAREAADIFAADNPLFDRDKFLAACGVTA